MVDATSTASRTDAAAMDEDGMELDYTFLSAGSITNVTRALEGPGKKRIQVPEKVPVFEVACTSDCWWQIPSEKSKEIFDEMQKGNNAVHSPIKLC